MTSFSRMTVADYVEIAAQPSQLVGIHHIAEPAGRAAAAEDLIDRGAAWTARAGDGRILGCAGIYELFAGKHGLAWAVLAEGIGAAHLAISRFARARIAESGLNRIEAMANACDGAACRWPMLLGMEAAAVLRKWGPDEETLLLFEKVN